jgi:gas vesicle protein
MSDEARDGGSGSGGGGGGVGGFLFGVLVGGALGLLFAPAAGGATRRRLARGLDQLRERAVDEARELRALVSADETEAEEAPRSDREALRRRLAEARRQRRSPAAARRGGAAEPEEDDPVA